MSFRRRLALLSASAVMLVGLSSAAAVYVLVRQQLHAELVDQLWAQVAVHESRDFELLRQVGTLDGAGTPAPPVLPRLVSPSGQILAARFPRLAYPVTSGATEVAAGRRASSLETVRFGDDRLKVLTVQAGPGRAFQLAQSLAAVDETLGRLRLGLVAVAAAAMVVSPVAGLLVAGGGLRPVRRLTRAADDIARTGHLDYRIEVRGEDELGSLAASFNAMLDRLAGIMETLVRARQSQRQLAADVSHELRTPLASLRANVELFALGPSDDPTRPDLAADILQQLDALTALVGQLIELAREEMREPERAPVALDAVVREAVDRARQRYLNVEFVVDLQPTTLFGAPEALASAVANLLDNAAQSSPLASAAAVAQTLPMTTVEVRLGNRTLSVRDHGSGIDEADLAHVFERFYRGAGARERPGSGLGLAIVAQVVAAHGGEVRAEHAPGGGALFTAQFPEASPADS